MDFGFEIEDKISKEQAVKEVRDFVLSLNYRPAKIKALSEEGEECDRLCDLIMEGSAIITEDGTIIYKLEKPLKDETTELEFKRNRVPLSNVKKFMKGKTEIDKTVALISKMFTKPVVSSLFEDLDDDWANIQKLSGFFLMK